MTFDVVPLKQILIEVFERLYNDLKYEPNKLLIDAEIRFMVKHKFNILI